MTRKELLYTVTIYDEKSFSAAAKKLYISQSALSQAIRKLEENLGIDLFIRSGAKTEPTRACHVLVQQGRQLLLEWNRFEAEIQIFAKSQRSELTVGMPPFFMKNLAPHIIPLFEAAHPNVKLELIESSSNTLERLAMQGMINLCVVTEPVFLEGIERISVLTAELLLAVPAGHPFCKAHPYRGLDRLEQVGLWELKNEPFSLLKNPRKEKVWEQLFADSGFDPLIYRMSTVWSNVKDYVKQGACVAPIHEFIVTHEPDDDSICYYRLDPPRPLPDVVVAYSPGKRLTQQERWFIDTLRQYRVIAQRQQTEE